MALSRVKTWISGEVLTASDLNSEFNNILNNPGSLITPIGFNLTFTDATYDIGASGATRPRDLFLSRNATIGGDVTLSGGQMGGFYQWTNWNPADVAGTNTNAPGTGTATANANFVAFSNSSGTVTATVAKVGKYRVRVSCGQSHAAAYKLNDSAYYFMGVAGTPDTACTMPTVDRFQVGHLQGVSFLYGWTRYIGYYPMRLPTNNLRAFSLG